MSTRVHSLVKMHHVMTNHELTAVHYVQTHTHAHFTIHVIKRRAFVTMSPDCAFCVINMYTTHNKGKWSQSSRVDRSLIKCMHYIAENIIEIDCEGL